MKNMKVEIFVVIRDEGHSTGNSQHNELKGQKHSSKLAKNKKFYNTFQICEILVNFEQQWSSPIYISWDL
jgi:uncharacterized membrane protein